MSILAEFPPARAASAPAQLPSERTPLELVPAVAPKHAIDLVTLVSRGINHRAQLGVWLGQSVADVCALLAVVDMVVLPAAESVSALADAQPLRTPPQPGPS
jgi:hypothetical protein